MTALIAIIGIERLIDDARKLKNLGILGTYVN